mgnify:CR=1 FL=1
MCIRDRGKVHIVYRALFPFDENGIYYVSNVKKKFKSWEKLTDFWFFNPRIKVNRKDTINIACERSNSLYCGDNTSGNFKFNFSYEMPQNSILADSYFTVGDSSNCHFTFHTWLGQKPDYTGAEIYYLRSVSD